jgi:hypothetical protein
MMKVTVSLTRVDVEELLAEGRIEATGTLDTSEGAPVDVTLGVEDHRG